MYSRQLIYPTIDEILDKMYIPTELKNIIVEYYDKCFHMIEINHNLCVKYLNPKLFSDKTLQIIE